MNHPKPVLLFKYGGNAMTNDQLQEQVLTEICSLKKNGFDVVIVHGGGPFIQKALIDAKIESEFIDGHRKTSPEAYAQVEMTLKGRVNSQLVANANFLGFKAVGLSGRDGGMVVAKKRIHRSGHNEADIDLGRVGDVDTIDISVVQALLSSDMVPIITCVASDKNGVGYNINADMFAGHLSGALSAEAYVVLTDVDGILENKTDPDSLINSISLKDLSELRKSGVVQGGMIPKIESCEIALLTGAKSARIINGTQPDQIRRLKSKQSVGTLISK